PPAFRKPIDLAPKSKTAASAYRGLGKVLEFQGKLDEAIAYIQKAADLDPGFAEYQSVLAWLLMNCREVRLRDPRRGLEAARKAVELQPEWSFSWQMLGWARYRTGDWKASVEALEKSCALQDDPKGGDAFQWFFLAMAQGEVGEKDKARAWYDRAVEWTEKNQPKREELRRFRAEAAELLEPNEKK